MTFSYKNLVRKVSDYLHEQCSKKTFWSRFIPEGVFSPEFWKWQRDSVATGLGWGSFFSIAPVPMQSLWGAGACVWRKGNIPIAVFAAWLSPPGTLIFSVPLQWYLGSWIMDLTPIGGSGHNYGLVKTAVKDALEDYSLSPIKVITSELGLWHMIGEFFLGVIASCSVLGIFCYLMVHLIWRLATGIKKLTLPKTRSSSR